MMNKTLLASVGALATGILLAASPAKATTLLDLIDPPLQSDTSYSLAFTATSSATTISIAGYQVPSFEYATDNGLFLDGTGPNLLGQTWNFTAAASGSDTGQYYDGTSVNALAFGGVSAGYYDTYSQTVDTTVGSYYYIDLLYTENGGAPSAFVVTTSGLAAADVPEPASMALLGAGIAGLGMIRRRRRA